MGVFIKATDRTLSLLCTLLAFGMTVGVIVSVFARYLFNISFAWSEETIIMLFSGTTYFGTALGVREKEHITITYVEEKASPTVRKMIQILSNVVIACVSAAVFWQSLLWIRKVGGVPSPVTHIPYGYFYVMVPISSLLVIFYAGVNIASLFSPIPPADKGYGADDEVSLAQLENSGAGPGEDRRKGDHVP